MKKELALLFAAVILSGPVQAQMPVSAGDYYIRSQQPSGTFFGYHQVMTEPKTGYVRAVYCNTIFWVRKSTVLWTENEAKAGRHLFIEMNLNGDRKLICADPDEQVRLEDLGMKEAEVRRFRNSNGQLDQKKSRMNVLSEAFKQRK
ncbi:hypothetical protein [Roseibium polysiphoniae]|nr:hypothetical protein [Roseibium polysiphoniae]